MAGEGGCLCQWELKALTDRLRSDCVHEQVAKRIANVRFTNDYLSREDSHFSVRFSKEQKKCLYILWIFMYNNKVE